MSADDLLRWWPVLLTSVGLVGWAVRTEMLAKAATKDLADLDEAIGEKLTNYATTADLAEVRGQVLVAISQLNDLKPTLTRLENKLDAFLIRRVRDGEDK